MLYLKIKQGVQNMIMWILHFNFNVFFFFFNVLTWPTRKLTTSIISLVDYMFSKTKSTIQKLLILWSIIVMLVLISLLLYAAFYSAYVPAAEISRPVHLAFSVCPSGVGICSFPSANVSFWNDEAGVQEFLSSGQPYSVKVILDMPDSLRNRGIGMFMIVIKMYDRDGSIYGLSQRSVSMSDATVFQYRSLFWRALDMVFMKPLYIVGLLEQKRTMNVEVFTNFVDEYHHPSVGAIVEVHSHAIDVYSAILILSAKFTGLKYFLYNWPLVSTICAFWFNLSALAIGVGIVLYMRSELSQKKSDKQKITGDSKKDQKNLHQTSYQSSLDSQTNKNDAETHSPPLGQSSTDGLRSNNESDSFIDLRNRRIN